MKQSITNLKKLKELLDGVETSVEIIRKIDKIRINKESYINALKIDPVAEFEYTILLKNDLSNKIIACCSKFHEINDALKQQTKNVIKDYDHSDYERYEERTSNIATTEYGRYELLLQFLINETLKNGSARALEIVKSTFSTSELKTESYILIDTAVPRERYLSDNIKILKLPDIDSKLLPNDKSIEIMDYNKINLCNWIFPGKSILLIKNNIPNRFIENILINGYKHYELHEIRERLFDIHLMLLCISFQSDKVINIKPLTRKFHRYNLFSNVTENAQSDVMAPFVTDNPNNNHLYIPPANAIKDEHINTGYAQYLKIMAMDTFTKNKTIQAIGKYISCVDADAFQLYSNFCSMMELLFKNKGVKYINREELAKDVDAFTRGSPINNFEVSFAKEFYEGAFNLRNKILHSERHNMDMITKKNHGSKLYILQKDYEENNK